MNINPNDPNVDSSIDTTPPDIPAPPASLPGDTGSAPPIDSISTSTDIGATSGVGFDFLQLDRPLTIMDFARVVLDTIDNFRQEIYVMERLEAATMKKFHIDIMTFRSRETEKQIAKMDGVLLGQRIIVNGKKKTMIPLVKRNQHEDSS